MSPTTRSVPSQTFYHQSTEGTGATAFQHSNPVSPVYAESATFDAERLNQINRLGMQLRDFIFDCDSVLSSLVSAQNSEVLDAQTDNSDFFGYFISNSSYHKNHDVANQVDDLKHRIYVINSALMQAGSHLMPLNIDLDGSNIREAENAEHSFWANLFTSNAHSAYASCNTLGQLTSTAEKVRRVRNQAENNLFYLNAHQQQGRPFFASHLR